MHKRYRTIVPHVAAAIAAANALEFEVEPLRLLEAADAMQALDVDLAEELRAKARRAVRLRTLLAEAHEPDRDEEPGHEVPPSRL